MSKRYVYSAIPIDEVPNTNNKSETMCMCEMLFCVLLFVFLLGLVLFSLYLDLYDEMNCIRVYINEMITINEATHIYSNKWHVDNHNHIWYWNCTK